MSYTFENHGEWADIWLLDPYGQDADVVVSIDDTGGAFMKQVDPVTDKVDLIFVNTSMLDDLVEALAKHKEAIDGLDRR
jgi:hypothetical protein